CFDGFIVFLTFFVRNKDTIDPSLLSNLHHLWDASGLDLESRKVTAEAMFSGHSDHRSASPE
ncbi:MAG: hypothetical protein ACYC0V_10675, partial [Armatimonadota bacterium]